MGETGRVLPCVIIIFLKNDSQSRWFAYQRRMDGGDAQRMNICCVVIPSPVQFANAAEEGDKSHSVEGGFIILICD